MSPGSASTFSFTHTNIQVSKQVHARAHTHVNTTVTMQKASSLTDGYAAAHLSFKDGVSSHRNKNSCQWRCKYGAFVTVILRSKYIYTHHLTLPRVSYFAFLTSADDKYTLFVCRQHSVCKRELETVARNLASK